ncbi:MAG: IPT/TIG domain-containing protein [Flammeovirgaceae bacterium]|nr:IPT/TIG domain-containing protein [Flammeovirgaceae bacterium]
MKFNTTPISSPNFTVVSPTQIKVNVPAGAATGKISVTTPAGTGSSANNFTVLAPPTITSFSPAIGLQGSSVVITGTGFSGITSVSFNDVVATTFTVISSTQINVTLLANATRGKIKVTNTLGTATSANTFYVTPFISAISPTSGAAGSTLTITGTNLAAATVKFNSTSVPPTTNTNTSITVIVPSIASGSVNVTVVNLGGTSNSKTFTITSPVVLNEIVATANIAGQLILLNGSNLLGATKVYFGNVAADVYTNTSSVVTSIIPASLAVGNYTVTVVTSNGTSNGKPFQLLSVQNPNTGVSIW